MKPQTNPDVKEPEQSTSKNPTGRLALGRLWNDITDEQFFGWIKKQKPDDRIIMVVDSWFNHHTHKDEECGCLMVEFFLHNKPEELENRNVWSIHCTWNEIVLEHSDCADLTHYTISQKAARFVRLCSIENARTYRTALRLLDRYESGNFPKEFPTTWSAIIKQERGGA